MKQTPVLAIILAMFFLFQASAMAGPKPPKVLCIDWQAADPDHVTMVLVTKATGAIAPLASGDTKFYSVHGEILGLISAPCTGTGHMNGEIFHFSVKCVFDNSSDLSAVFFFEARWDVTTRTGTGGLYGATSGGGFQPRVDLSLTPLNCRTLILDH